MAIPIFITTYNRATITRQSLESLLLSHFHEPVHIKIFDDGSREQPLKTYLEDLRRRGKIGVFFDRATRGASKAKTEFISKSLQNYSKAPYFVVNDSDMIYHEDWYKVGVDLFKRLRNSGEKIGIVTCFNTPVHPVEIWYKDYGEKKSLGGCNMIVNRDFYDAYCNKVIPSNFDWRWVDACREHDYKMITTVPSYAQHIGKTGMHSKTHSYDRANDYIGSGPISIPESTGRRNINTTLYWDKRFRESPIWKNREKAYQWCVPYITGKSLLDLGCATGDGLKVLANNFPDMEIYGADFSSLGIEYARKRFGDRFFVHDMNKGILMRTYDNIIIVQTLQHLEDPNNVIKKYLDYCKNMIITVPNRRAIEDKEHLWRFDENSLDFFSPRVINKRSHLIFVIKGKL